MQDCVDGTTISALLERARSVAKRNVISGYAHTGDVGAALITDKGKTMKLGSLLPAPW